MAAITWANVVDFDATLSTIHANAQTAILAYVNGYFNVDTVDPVGGEDGATLRLLRIYLAAHLGRVNLQSSSATGPVQSESAGGLSRSYGSSVTNEALATTKWGNLYLALLRRTPARCPVII